MLKVKNGFTLAEMMVVLLILSIVLAAMAPVITTRMKRGSSPAGAGGSTVWQWAANNVDAYFGADSNQTAMIGQSTSDSGSTSRLTINTSDNKRDHIQFKNGDNVLGRLTLDGSNNLILGNTLSTGSSQIYDTDAGMLSIGKDNNLYKATSSIFLGSRINNNIFSGYEQIQENVIIGNSAGSSNKYNVVIGPKAYASNSYNVVIGSDASSSNSNNVAIGKGAKASTPLGKAYAVAIGDSSEAGQNKAIAIGSNANALFENVTAIGANACRSVKKGNVTCIGNDSGYGSTLQGSINPASYHTTNSSGTANVEIVYLGSQSTFNDAPSVVEILNDKRGSNFTFGSRSAKATGLVVNGNLFVKGTIYTGVYGVQNKVYALDSDRMVDLGTPSGIYSPYAYGGANPTTVYSDKRLKYVGQEFNSGLDKIRQIKVFNYTFKKDETKTPHIGVIAQDLQNVFPDAVKKEKDGFLTIRLEDMFYAVINAVKELDVKVKSIVSDLSKQDAAIEALKNDNERLRKENLELKNRLDKLEAKIK